MAWGGTEDAACELAARTVLAAMPAYNPAPEIIAETVLPTSPRTSRLAMKGISAIAIENKTLTAPKRIIWLEPTNALRTPFPPSTAFTLFICKAVMRTWRIA
jgi:hypothetical protein